MAVKQVPFLKPSSNIDMMNMIREQASDNYRARIPVVDQANIKATMQGMMQHRATRNEFMDVLINRIGLVTVRERSWTNPLAVFKKGMLQQGDTVEELALDIAEAKVHDHDREAMERILFGTHRIGAQASFHKVNTARRYDATTNEMELSRAFLDTQGGLHSFQGQLVEALMTGDQWDEYLMMASLFEQMAEEGGFFNVQTPDLHTLESSEAEAKKALRILRTYAGKLKFLSRLYNPAALPVAVKESEIVVITTPEFRAAVDVDALAGAFNVERANIIGRVVEVQAEDIGIPGFQAAITTEDFFQVYDKVLQTTTQFNAASLSTNYFLHHHQIMSASRFVPAVLFTTNPNTQTFTISYVPTSISAITATIQGDTTQTNVTGALAAGQVYGLYVDVTTNPAGKGEDVPIMYGLIGNTDPQTFIGDTGVLHVGPNETGSLQVTAFATEDMTVKSATRSFTVDPDSRVALWPRDRDGDGIPDVPGVYVAWAATTGYTVGDRVKLTGGAVLEATAEGTSGATAPAAPAEVGDTVLDGTVTWKRIV